MNRSFNAIRKLWYQLKVDPLQLPLWSGYLVFLFLTIFSPSWYLVAILWASYRVTCPVEEDYTLVPYSWLNLNLTPCALQVLLCCRMFMLKERDRAFPSIRKIAAVACIAKSTVCAALNQIKLIGALIIQVCQKVDGAFACNSYHIVKQVVQKAVTTLQMEGWVPQIQHSAKYEISGINPLSIL